MIAPRILLLLTLAAAFPKDYRYGTRLSEQPIPSQSKHSGVHAYRRWMPPLHHAFTSPFLQGNFAPAVVPGKSAFKGGKKSTGKFYVIPATLIPTPSLYGQLNSPKQQVLVLTGNSIISLGDKSKGQGGKIAQVFIASNNDLIRKGFPVIYNIKVPKHVHQKDHGSETVAVGGEIELHKTSLGAELSGEAFLSKDVSKETELGVQDIVLVVPEKDHERDQQTVNIVNDKVTEGEQFVVEETGVASLGHELEDLTGQAIEEVEELVLTAPKVDEMESLLQEGVKETVLGQVIEDALMQDVASAVLVVEDENVDAELTKPLLDAVLPSEVDAVKDVGLSAQDQSSKDSLAISSEKELVLQEQLQSDD